MQVCTSLQTDNHATPAPHHSVFFTGRMPFLPPNQQRQSTEGTNAELDRNRLICRQLWCRFSTSISCVAVRPFVVSSRRRSELVAASAADVAPAYALLYELNTRYDLKRRPCRRARRRRRRFVIEIGDLSHRLIVPYIASSSACTVSNWILGVRAALSRIRRTPAFELFPEILNYYRLFVTTDQRERECRQNCKIC